MNWPSDPKSTRCRASVCGSPGTAAWSAPPWCAAWRERLRSSYRRAQRRRPAPSGRRRALDGRQPATRRVRRRRQGGRHSRQRHAPGRVPLRQPDDRGQRHRCRVEGWRREAAVPRILVHLSEAGAATDHRGRAAHRPARADQRVVRDRQDRRHQAVPGLSQAVRLRLHLGHADQPLRPGRQLSTSTPATSSPR